ncbi:STAS domain-containing protein [Streptomyces sp. NPDC004959]|uniref:STAS domain-containing protein n=1 Tax=unclassified Streptomyces TaxID=2593676 RepID=UPI00068EFD78|nr:STAS domain-containing protein [Streptomyces sp. NRRL F-5630]
MSPLTISIRYATTGPVLEITGDLDHSTALELRTAVEGLTLATGQLLVLGLARLDFCDSSGISALLSARSWAIEQGGGIVLAAVPANTARILGIVGLDKVFTLRPDVSTATSSGTSADPSELSANDT